MPTTRRRANSSPLPTEAMSQPQSLQSRPGRASMTLRWVLLEPINNRPLSRPRNARPIAPRLGRRPARHGIRTATTPGMPRRLKVTRSTARPHRAKRGRLRTPRGRHFAVTQGLLGALAPPFPVGRDAHRNGRTDCNTAAADGRTPLELTRNPRTAAILRNCISKQDAARMQKDTSQTMH